MSCMIAAALLGRGRGSLVPWKTTLSCVTVGITSPNCMASVRGAPGMLPI